MGTSFTEVYDFFLQKVTDYSFLDTSIYETQEELEEELYKYLRSSIIKFRQSKVSLVKGEDGKSFANELSDYEKEILSLLMVSEYLTPKIISTEKMESRLTDREYREFSQAKQLEQMRQLKKDVQLNISQLVNDYTYADGLAGLQ